MVKRVMICLVVLFATNAYADLVIYDNSGTNPSQYKLDAALTLMGLSFTELASIDSGDLSSGDVLVIPWNNGGDMSGLDSSIWGAITGNRLLTGHDADWHAAMGTDSSGNPGDAVGQTAQTFLGQAITFAGAQGGVGLVALGDYSTAFSYLPAAWGISSTGGLLGETIGVITAEGLASGVYNGLDETDMSNWHESYHADFYPVPAGWQIFEEHASVLTPETIAYVVPAPAAVLLGMLGLSAAGLKLRKSA